MSIDLDDEVERPSAAKAAPKKPAAVAATLQATDRKMLGKWQRSLSELPFSFSVLSRSQVPKIYRPSTNCSHAVDWMIFNGSKRLFLVYEHWRASTNHRPSPTYSIIRRREVSIRCCISSVNEDIWSWSNVYWLKVQILRWPTNGIDTLTIYVRTKRPRRVSVSFDTIIPINTIIRWHKSLRVSLRKKSNGNERSNAIDVVKRRNVEPINNAMNTSSSPVISKKRNNGKHSWLFLTPRNARWPFMSTSKPTRPMSYISVVVGNVLRRSPTIHSPTSTTSSVPQPV